jgi:L-rhamnose 1-dehydrogenase
MAAQSPPGGSIIAISSISALVGGGEQTHYTPTKAGIKSESSMLPLFVRFWLLTHRGPLGLMESCAIALGPKGIRCNSILPGSSCSGPPPLARLNHRMGI